MIRNIILIIVLLSFATMCGKKGDPFYKESKKLNNDKSIIVKWDI